MKIYGDSQSGNCYKVQLVAALLNIDYIWVDVDILADETHSELFLKMNPSAKIPVLELDDGRFLSESNAIINFLAANTPLLPTNSFLLGKVQQWQFFEQYSHEPYIAVARFIAKYLGLPESRKAEYFAKQEGGHHALQVMEEQLQRTPYLIGDDLTTADISLYAYTHVAEEGGFKLDDYPAIKHWLKRIQADPGYIAMQ